MYLRRSSNFHCQKSSLSDKLERHTLAPFLFIVQLIVTDDISQLCQRRKDSKLRGSSLLTHTQNSQFRIGSDSLTSTMFSRSIVWPFEKQNKTLDPIETFTCKTVDVMDAAGSNHGNNWANLVELSKSKCGSEFRATLQSDGTLFRLHCVLIRAKFRMLMATNLVAAVNHAENVSIDSPRYDPFRIAFINQFEND